MMFDSATEANSDAFFLSICKSRIFSVMLFPPRVIGNLAEQNGMGPFCNACWTNSMPTDRFDHPGTLLKPDCKSVNAKNSLSRVKGYTPELLVLGKNRRLPGSVTDDSEVGSNITASETESGHFQEQLAIREAARIAFVKADNCQNLRRALHGRSRPNRVTFQWVMYWKEGKGAEKANGMDRPKF